MKRPVLGMILKGYPRISETFISNEIELLEAQGFDIRILSMRKPRESFDRPPHKPPVLEEEIETAVRAVVHDLRMTAERELASRRVGEFVMARLRKLDQVAFVRFASVYRAFEDVDDFREELDRLQRDILGEGQLPLLGAAPARQEKRRK